MDGIRQDNCQNNRLCCSQSRSYWIPFRTCTIPAPDRKTVTNTKRIHRLKGMLYRIPVRNKETASKYGSTNRSLGKDNFKGREVIQNGTPAGKTAINPVMIAQ